MDKSGVYVLYSRKSVGRTLLSSYRKERNHGGCPARSSRAGYCAAGRLLQHQGIGRPVSGGGPPPGRLWGADGVLPVLSQPLPCPDHPGGAGPALPANRKGEADPHRPVGDEFHVSGDCGAGYGRLQAGVCRPPGLRRSLCQPVSGSLPGPGGRLCDPRRWGDSPLPTGRPAYQRWISGGCPLPQFLAAGEKGPSPRGSGAPGPGWLWDSRGQQPPVPASSKTTGW